MMKNLFGVFMVCFLTFNAAMMKIGGMASGE